MAGRQHQPLLRRLAQLALALVLVLPIVSSTHTHGIGAAAQPGCEVCTVAKHAPAVVGGSVTVALPLPLVGCVGDAPVEREHVGRCWRPAGRAPPSSAATRHT